MGRKKAREVERCLSSLPSGHSELRELPMDFHSGYTPAIRQGFRSACCVGYTVDAPDSMGRQSPTTVADDKLLDALACVCCGEPVSHVVQFEGLRVAAFGWCDGCFSALGGEDGYEAILAEVIRQREQARRN